MPFSREQQSILLGKTLYFFAFYTLTIKYFIPVGWAFHQNVPISSFIFFWDAWWIAHIAAGYGLTHLKKGVWVWAMILTLAEITIIMTKFTIYFAHPNFDFWHWLWLINKCLLLIYFFILMLWLVRRDVRQLL